MVSVVKYRDRVVYYLGKAEDGKFYHIVKFKSTYHIYVREFRVPPWRWITRRVGVGEAIARSVREFVEKVIKPTLKPPKVVVEVVRDIVDNVEYVMEALKLIRKLLETLDETLKGKIYEVRDAALRERLRRLLFTPIMVMYHCICLTSLWIN